MADLNTSSQIMNADFLIKIAEKRIHSWSLFNPDKWGEAGDLYMKASDFFKIQNNFKNAGFTYIRATECYLKNKDEHSANKAYLQAARIFRGIDDKLSLECYQRVIEFSLNNGDFYAVGGCYQEIAEFLEQINLKSSLENYNQAARFFALSTIGRRSRTKCLEKIVFHKSLQEDYNEVIKILEDLICSSGKGDYKIFIAREYTFQILLTRFVQGDIVAISKDIYHYQQHDPQITGTHKFNFLNKLYATIESRNYDQYLSLCHNFKKTNNLTKWEEMMIDRIIAKFSLTENNEDLT